MRKVKCDETKPFCRKCVDTGRTCDGYESLFRVSTSQSINNAHGRGIKSNARLQTIRPTLNDIAPWDIELLNRYFSTKTIFDVELDCKEEARQVLQASLTDLPIKHAVSSLKAFREHLETSGDVRGTLVQQTLSYDYGLKQYCMALGGLASDLSSPGPNRLNSALLCCQIFISIEQVRGNYAAMAQHIIQGLRIMHQYRARPNFVTGNKLVPANGVQLPFLDIFVIKLFAAPCKFADSPATNDVSGTTVSMYSISPYQQSVKLRHLRPITPDMRPNLTKIAMSTLDLLSKVSQVESAGNALQLLSKKEFLLYALESWLVDLEIVQMKIRPFRPELVSVSFMRFFHQTLRTVLLGTLDSSPNLYAKLQTEYDRLRDIASILGERTCSGTRSR